MKGLRHEAFHTSLPAAPGECSPRPHSSPARSLDSIQLLAAALPLCRLVMSEPGWWVHERVIVPARTKSHRLARVGSEAGRRSRFVDLAGLEEAT